ncbi:hypothetical protein BH09CHL1_BH09CHL1_12360 [soil metagenome]
MVFARVFNRARHHRAVAVMAAIALISMLAIGPRGAFALIQQIGDSPSPATGHAQIIAQGVSPLPDTNSVWRVTQATAGSLDSGEPTNYALGFTAATDGGVLVNDYTTGLQSRLSNGEAAFTSSGAYQQHASLSGDNVSYLRIGLVGSGESSDGTVFQSDEFSSPEGRRDIDLLRDVLGEGESTTVNAGSAASLVYAVTGEVVIADGDTSTTLQAGQGVTVDGEFTIESQVGQSIVLAAVIGNDVPAPPRISGTVTLDIRACPADVTKEQLEAAAAEGSSAAFESCVGLADPAKAGLEIGLTPNGSDALALKDADLGDEDGVVTWDALSFGDYSLGDITAYPDGYNDSVMSDGNLNLGDHGDFTLNRDNPDVSRVIYLLSEPTGSGSLTVTYYECQVATMDEFDSDACRTLVGEVPAELTGSGIDTPLTLADADRSGGNTWTWNELPVATSDDPLAEEQGSYFLAVGLESGDPSPQIVVDGAEYNEETDSYAVALTPDKPEATVSVYSVIVVGDSAGVIDITGIACPTIDAELSECDANGSMVLAGVTITTASGESITQDSAVTYGDLFVWNDLPLDDTYTVSAENIIPPDGYQVRTILQGETGETGDSLDATMTGGAPSAYFRVYLDPISEDPGTPVDVDTDGDGLSDEDETALGTSVDNADSDADCHSDGSEVDASTDPLDAGSFPEGECNI